MRILLAEDDLRLTRVLRDGLVSEGHEVVHEMSAKRARGRAVETAFDAIILDVMLPGGSGVDVCRYWRERGITTPVLMLTARDGVDDRVSGLDAGADDYLTKPFAVAELLARLRVFDRRRTAKPGRVVVADLEVDFKSHRVSRGGAVVDLSTKELALLEVLVLHRDEVVDRMAITEQVWDDNHDPFTNLLESLVSRLRRKIDGPSKVKLIHTHRGAGYRLGL
jgi:two-component system copper resistance phosphate regulon response regulator CusR